MTRLGWLFVSLGIFSLVLAGVFLGQPDSPGWKGGGPSDFYNPQTVVSVAGIVVSVTAPGAKGLPELVYLTLQTEKEKIVIFLGPSVAIDKLPVKINTLDKIQVTGSKTIWEGQPMIIAAEVKKGDHVLKLREPDGVPVWSGRGRK